ncbi:DUF2827 domain-containing protein [Burkholderia ubonensis]|uniref:DUF2827 domain-containing protein n=1 Tax=Burkholderia ubonensis TaxID=101571 RepID=A0AA40UXB9_9BURK|nr:DUF2827 domain-containing protein [Burkholderia ubonensis]KVZ43638.1 hypothetical protein WL16_26180 [Burkholderia ubonensis]KWZ58371.1 hypothetical protein WK57_17865 [Burkholderia ubonensis]
MNTSAERRVRPTNLRVGVSIYVRKGEQSLWENGIFQNCIFLVMLLLRSPLVRCAYLVAGGGDGRPEDAKTFLKDSPVPVIDMAEAAASLDVMIEMSAQLDRDWIVAFRARGGKIVSMRVGNDYVIDIERMTFHLPPGLLITGAPYHEVWTLAEYEATCQPYFRSTFRAPVRIVPHLWSPVVLERAVAALPQGEQFGYQPGRRRWRAGMFEPNVCMVKTSYMPLLCCEVAYRANPEIFDHVWAYNTFKLRDHPSFNSFANSLDIVRHGLTSFEGRFPFYRVVARDVDVIVCHQWENAQNYVYYEALYGGYPLIHNSHLIGGCGYRYHDFDCEEGGQALQQAFNEHDQNLSEYRQKAQAFLQTLDPESAENVRFYSDAISALYLV